MKGLRAASHAQYVLINRVATPLGGVLVLVIIGHHSDTLLGEYAVVMTYFYIMQMLPLLGLTSYVMREVARAPARAGEFFSTIGALSLLGCAVVDLFCYFFLHFMHYSTAVRQAITVTGVVIVPGILVFIAELIFMSLNRARPVAIMAVLENLSRVALSAITLLRGDGLVGLLAVFLITRFSALVGYLILMRRGGIVTRYELPNRRLMNETLSVVPAFLTGTVLFAIFYRLDFIVISIYEPVQYVGYYAIGYRLFEISTIMLTGLIMALFPWVSRKFVGARQRYRVAIKSVMLSFGVGLLCVSFVGIMLANVYVLLMFPNQYPQPVLLTQLFMAALLISGLDFVGSGILHASDLQASEARAMAVGGVCNALLLFTLVPLAGIYGAFYAKLIASLIQGGVKFYLIEKRVGRVWELAEFFRFLILIALLSAGTVLALQVDFPLRIVTLVLGLALIPLLAITVGLIQPLRLLRYYWRPRGARDVKGIGDLLDVIARDLRACTRVRRHTLGRNSVAEIDLHCYGLLTGHLARCLSLRGHPRSSAAVNLTGRYFVRMAGLFARRRSAAESSL